MPAAVGAVAPPSSWCRKLPVRRHGAGWFIAVDLRAGYRSGIAGEQRPHRQFGDHRPRPGNARTTWLAIIGGWTNAADHRNVWWPMTSLVHSPIITSRRAGVLPRCGRFSTSAVRTFCCDTLVRQNDAGNRATLPIHAVQLTGRSMRHRTFRLAPAGVAVCPSLEQVRGGLRKFRFEAGLVRGIGDRVCVQPFA